MAPLWRRTRTPVLARSFAANAPPPAGGPRGLWCKPNRLLRRVRWIPAIGGRDAMAMKRKERACSDGLANGLVDHQPQFLVFLFAPSALSGPVSKKIGGQYKGRVRTP
jgi:hypothetical protein